MKTHTIFLSLLLLTLVHSAYVHDHHNKDAPRRFLNDLTDGRLLQAETKGRFIISIIQHQNLYGLYTTFSWGTNRNKSDQKSLQHNC